MRFLSTILLNLCMISVGTLSQCETAQEYINQARGCEETDDLEAAIEVMREATEKYPEDPTAHAFLGLYLGRSAGETKDFQVQAARTFESFQVLDEAVSLDSLNVYARFCRGLMGVKVPEFLGRRDQGIEDLRTVLGIHAREPERFSEDLLVSTYTFLAEVYEEREQTEEALEAWRKVIELVPESEIAERARGVVERLSTSEAGREGMDAGSEAEVETESQPRKAEEMIGLGRTYYAGGDYEKAEEMLTKAVALDSSNAEAYGLLAMAIAMQAAGGYDEKIAEDTDLRINLCFRTMEYLDRAIDLAPRNVEMKLMRGVMGVNFPFFVGRLDQATADLNQVIESSAHDSMKAEAFYHLGLAHRKKRLTNWVKVVTEYPESRAAQLVFESMRPQTEKVDLSEYDTPMVVVDFVLGFQEELLPQTAVWVEDEKGNFVKTLYISGFAGNVGARQITLPTWGASSNFETDATTAASIDVGHHTYIWNLKDGSGKDVAGERYAIKVEVSYWPSMQYQFVSAIIEVGGGETKVRLEEGNLIPLLEVKYLP